MTTRDCDGEHITVRLPDELPVLTRSSYRILLDILIELTEVKVLDGPAEVGRDDY
jgi:hypothetical protein